MELLRTMVCKRYLDVRPASVSKSKEVCVFGCQEEYERLQAIGPKNKKIMLSKQVTFDETSLVKSTISQQVERLKIKDIL